MDESNGVVEPTYIEEGAASGLAQAFGVALQSADELPQIMPSQLVQSGNNLITKALENQLRFAEEQASRIKTLRQRLGKLPTTNQGPPNGT